MKKSKREATKQLIRDRIQELKDRIKLDECLGKADSETRALQKTLLVNQKIAIALKID